jgi:enoyl-CoA hydratase
VVSELIHTLIQDRIAVLSIAHPPANTLSQATVAVLHAAVQSALADAHVKVLVITGEGKLFAAGADINELAALHTRAEGEAFAHQGQALGDLIEQSPKPVIAALNGRFALGGGWELALACHLRLAEESTQVGSPEVQLGVMVGWGASQRLPRLVGPSKALELLLTGRRISAAEAERLGLLNKVVPDGTVLQEALSLARELAALSAPGLASTLAAVQMGLREGCARGQEEEARRFGTLCESDDWHEGTRAFLEKRQAQFSDH